MTNIGKTTNLGEPQRCLELFNVFYISFILCTYSIYGVFLCWWGTKNK